jgi:hypothetical protein
MTSQVLRPGDKLASTVSATKVVVIRAPAERCPEITCGGSPMVPVSQAPATGGSAGAAETLIGKRYTDATETVELLCISSGAGGLSCDGVPMSLKAAKPLPASD